MIDQFTATGPRSEIGKIGLAITRMDYRAAAAAGPDSRLFFEAIELIGRGCGRRHPE
jgi:hypothetical protein